MRSLATFMPAIYTEADQNDGSLAVVVQALDENVAEIEDSIQDLKNIAVPERSTFIQDNATKYGNPFPFMTDARWTNMNTVEQLVYLYQMRGTQVGIQQAVRLLSKINITVTQDLEYAWVLNESQLGE